MNDNTVKRRLMPFVLVMIALAGLLPAIVAQEDPPLPQPQEISLHPTFPLLDESGIHVLESGAPVSTMQTCGDCHDTEFIATHSYHVDIGLDALADGASFTGGQAWDISPGYFGRWDPLTYRYLSPAGDEVTDLTTVDWLRQFGSRHVGGGPAEYGRSGDRLTDLPDDAPAVETHATDPETGALVPWDWEASGVVEVNCFLCHIPQPDNEARTDALNAGQFQ
jgi:hypothetical protein